MTRHRPKQLRTKPTSAPRDGAGDKKISSDVSYRAARLMAEEGLVDIAAAVKKAASQMGVTERGGLPSDAEVQSALQLHQSLFQADWQPQECFSLRQTAVEIMRWLDRFSPWLIGAVLDGSANRFSQIELEMVLSDAKQLEMFLLNAGVRFEIRHRRSKPSHHEKLLSDCTLYEISIDEVPVCIALFSHHAARYSRLANRLKHPQARLADVEALLSG